MNRITNGNNLTMPPSVVDKNKDWQLEILMEKLRSKSSQYKSLTEIAKNVRMAMLDKRYALDSIEKSQHQKCLDTLQYSIKVTSLQSMVERLESLTRQLGLKFMVGPSDVELFISSDMFYLEIVLDQTGAVKDVKVHHESKMEQQSCAELVNCLSRGDFADFTAQLEGFASIYQLNAEKKIKCKAFTALQSLESDLSTLAQLQSFMKEPFNLLHKSPVGVLEKRRGGHPMKLTYFVSPYDLLNIEKGDIDPITIDTIISKSLGYSVTVCMEGSATHKLQTTTLITVNRNVNGKSTPSFSSLSSQNSAAIPACFVLKLNKPMPMCVSLVRQIQQLTELDSIEQSTTRPLLNLIVTHSSDGKMESDNNRGLFVTLPDQSHCYFMTENKNMDGVLINSIPFTHPAHVSQILVILRQQALFNAIISSCVRPNSRQDFENMTMFEISALSWTHISISLEHPMEESMATAEIDLTDISSLICRVCSPGTIIQPSPLNSLDTTSELSTKILNRCFSIPITMRSVIKLWERQSMRRNQYNGHENFSLPLGSGDPGGHKGAPGNNMTEFGGLDGNKIKQEPSGNSGIIIQGHQNMFLNESMIASANFHNFPSSSSSTTTITPATTAEGVLTNMELTNILSGTTTTIIDKSMKRQQKRKAIDELSWKNSKRRLGGCGDDSDLIETSSNDSTSRSTPISQETELTTTPNSGLGFQSDLELSSLDPTELLVGTDKSDFDHIEELGDVEEMLNNNNNNSSSGGGGNSSRRKSRDQKSPPIPSSTSSNLLLDLGEKNLVPPSVSITPIAATTSSSGFNQIGSGGGNAEKRPGIEIIPLATSAASISSITITPITSTQMKSSSDDSRNRGEKKSSKNRSDDKNRLDKKRKKKRDESPMGPPDKVPPKQDPLNKPVTVSIKPAESPPLGNINTPTSPNMMRKFNASPTQQQQQQQQQNRSISNSGKLSPNLMKPILKQSSSSHHNSPKHSPAHNIVNSPKHSIPGISSPKSHGTSPKHPSTSGSGKPSMSTLKNAANSPSSKSSSSGETKSKSSKDSSSSSRDKEKKFSSIFSVSSNSKIKSSSVKMKPLDLNTTSTTTVTGGGGGTGGGGSDVSSNMQDSLPSPSGSTDLSKSSNPNQVRNRKGSLSAIVDKLKSAQCDGVTDLSSNKSNSNRERSGQISSSSSSNKSNESGKSNKILGENKNNSEYMVKPSSDGIKLTINKTRSKDSSSISSNSSGKSLSNLNKSGTGSPKSHTGLKPGVNSGPASKKPQHFSQKTSSSSGGGGNSNTSSNSLSSLGGSGSSNIKSSSKIPGAGTKISSSSSSVAASGGVGGGSSSLTKSLNKLSSGSPKTSSSTITDLSRNKERPKLNKSNSDKSIFSTKDNRKSSPTQNREDNNSGGSDNVFKLSTSKMDPYSSPLMMEGLMKQLDKNFQIPKLSARSSSTTIINDEKKQTNKIITDNINNINRTTSSTTTNTVDTKIFDIMVKTDLSLPKYQLTIPGNKIFENSIDPNKLRINNINTTNNNPILLTTSSPKLKESDDGGLLLLNENEKKKEMPQNLSSSSNLVTNKDDATTTNFKMNYPSISVTTTTKTFPSNTATTSTEPLSLSTKSIDLTSKFVAPAPKDDNNSSSSTSSNNNNKKELLKTTKNISSDNNDVLLDFSSTNKDINKSGSNIGPILPFPQSPSVSVHIVKSPAPSPLINPSPHSVASPCITDDELMDEALIGLGK